MSRRAIALAAIAIALVSAPVAAHAQSPVKFGLAAGATLPQGDVGDVFNMGYHISGSVTGKPAMSPVGIRGEVMFHSFAADEETIFDGDNLNVLAGIINAEIGMSGVAARPYVIGGLGMYRSTFGDFDAETDFGFNIGAGIDFALSGFSSFAEIRFHSIQTEGESTNIIPISFGLRF